MAVTQRDCYCGKKFAFGVYFQHVSMRPGGERCAPYVSIVFLSQKHNPRSRRDSLDLVRSIEAVEDGHSDVKQYYIRIQFRRTADGLQAVARFTDDLPLRLPR